MTDVTGQVSCPRCSAPMVLRTARRGRRVGEQFWGCSTYPSCTEIVEVPTGEAPADGERMRAAAGSSAQDEFERRERKRRERVRETWPVAIGVTIIVMFMAYLMGQAYADARWGAAAAAGVALLFVTGYLARPQTIDAWRVGADGERRTGRWLDKLGEAGFVVLHDRKVPGYGGNLDHVVIGPTGVWAVETKSIAGKVVIEGPTLRIGGRRQDRIVDQVYREAAAVQVALGESLTAMQVTVTPVICIHRGELPWFNKTIRGVRLASGRQLVRLIRSGEPHLSAEQVQDLARRADRLLRPASS